jgi:Asp/Glu/hydantoin racemase
MAERILVINPNSNRDVTAAIDRALESLRFADGPEICCATLDDAPPGIETARHADQIVGPLCAMIAREDNRASAFVIACFGDPGLASARETTAKPVLGIGEAGITAALNCGERYGVLTNLPEDINPGLRQIRGLGLEARLAGIEAAGIAVVDLADAARAREGLLAAARRLKDRGAEVIVLGCAGMVPFGPDLEAATGIKVIDPAHAATGLAITIVRGRPRTGRTETG